MKISLIIFLTIFLINCNRDKKKTDMIRTIEEKIPDVILYDFTYKHTKGSETSWILYAKEAEVLRDENLIKVKNVNLVFYKDNKPDTTLTSKYGIVNENENILSAISNVELKTVDGDFLYTDVLNWIDKDARLYTDSPVKIIRKGGDIIEGVGLEANSKLEKITIFKKVKGKIYEKNR